MFIMYTDTLSSDSAGRPATRRCWKMTEIPARGRASVTKTLILVGRVDQGHMQVQFKRCRSGRVGIISRRDSLPEEYTRVIQV